jgi:hypothetical protein
MVRGSFDNCIEVFDKAFAELEITKKLVGCTSRKRNAEDKLIKLWKEINPIE